MAKWLLYIIFCTYCCFFTSQYLNIGKNHIEPGCFCFFLTIRKSATLDSCSNMVGASWSWTELPLLEGADTLSSQSPSLLALAIPCLSRETSLLFTAVFPLLFIQIVCTEKRKVKYFLDSCLCQKQENERQTTEVRLRGGTFRDIRASISFSWNLKKD